MSLMVLYVLPLRDHLTSKVLSWVEEEVLEKLKKEVS